MTPTIKTLTAVAALTLAAGSAMAQDTQSVPLADPDAAAISAPESGTTYVVHPDGTRETLAAADADTDVGDEAEDDEATAQDDADGQTAGDTADADEAPSDDAVAEAEDADEEGEVAADDEPAEDDAETVAEADTEDGIEVPAEEPADEIEQQITDVNFSFEGPFGRYDQHQLQRGLQVYTEICAACHGLQYVPLRTLGDETGPGLPEDQVRAYAAEFDKIDPETGDDVPREPTDHFPSVDPVDGMGPDLSLMAKARAGFGGPYGTGINQLFKGMGGPEYIHSILIGYTGETKEEAGTTLYENVAFPGGWISMPPPLDDDMVDFEDGHPTDLVSISKEVSAFLMWTAEPKMMQRKKMGVVAVAFLIVLSALLYLTNSRLWGPHKRPRRDS